MQLWIQAAWDGNKPTVRCPCQFWLTSRTLLISNTIPATAIPVLTFYRKRFHDWPSSVIYNSERTNLEKGKGNGPRDDDQFKWCSRLRRKLRTLCCVPTCIVLSFYPFSVPPQFFLSDLAGTGIRVWAIWPALWTPWMYPWPNISIFDIHGELCIW